MIGVTADRPCTERIESDRRQSRYAILSGIALALYVVFTALTAARHEAWADEAHSWLLARDTSLIQLWTHVLHYEGTPGLWQTILHLLIRAGTPYAGFNFISAAAGVAGAWLLIVYSPFPPLIRILLPFTYYLFFQYAVVARSYSLLPVLTFGCAVLYVKAVRQPVPFTAAASLLAAVSLDGFVLGVVFYGAFLIDALWFERRSGTVRRRTIGVCAGAFLLTSILLAWSAWPAPDNQFVTHLNWSFMRLVTLTASMFRYAFTGEWVTLLAVLGLSFPLLRRGGTLWMFVIAGLSLCVAHSLIYVDVWHIGAIFLAWLFSMWVAGARGGVNRFATWAFLVVIAFQAYWSVRTGLYDWRQPYSGSREAARFLLLNPDISEKGIYLTGYSSEAIKPWFSLPDLNRFTHQSRPAFWDWSDRRRGDDPVPLLATTRFGYLLTGYKLPAEKDHWADIASLAGFQLRRHFEGNLFWRTSILEGESFDLYERTGAPPLADLQSSLDMADPAAKRQILAGLHGPEADAWRWTEEKFSLTLLRPPGAETAGARLSLKLFIPDNQIRDLGAMTLRASVNGRQLGEGTRYTAPGDATFTCDVPAEDLLSPLPVFTFTFDKTRAPAGNENRQLSAIAKSISLETK